MIRFQTEKIKKYGKTLHLSIGKMDPYSECFLLDFSNNCIQFKSDEDDETGLAYYGQLDIDFDGEHENFWVDGVTFLHICRSFDTIEIEDFVFTAVDTEEKFQLKRLDTDEFDNSGFDMYDFDFDTANKLNYNVIATLSTALDFTSIENNYPNVYVDEAGGGIAYAGDSMIYTERKIEWNLGSAQFSPVSIRLLTGLINTNEEIRIGFEDGILFVGTKDLNVVVGYSTSANEIDFENENFRAMFEHETSVKISKSDFIDVLKFLEPFMRDSNNKVSINLFDGDVIVKPEIEDYKAEKVLKGISYSDELEGKSFYMISEPVKKALGSMRSTDVEIRCSADNDKAPLCFQSDDALVVIPRAV